MHFIAATFRAITWVFAYMLCACIVGVDRCLDMLRNKLRVDVSYPHSQL
jgi:hypothetical protein